MNFLQKYPTNNGVFQLSTKTDFENEYIAVRKKESRIYSDDIVGKLPLVPLNHLHNKEWKLRNNTLVRFKKKLAKRTLKNILDIGCGNGWFTNWLNEAFKAQVLGVDINQFELEQAARIFTSKDCFFAYADIFKTDMPKNYFDAITLNASIQYFQNISMLINKLKELLTPNGSIYILDSPFYSGKEIIDAKKRSNNYYSTLGIPLMANNYHHHNLDDIAHYTILYKPKKIDRLSGKYSPFPLVKVL